MKERILICGGREYHDREYFYERMNYARKWFAEQFLVIQGGARGADRLAAVWSFEVGCAMMQMPANWYLFDTKAGAIRNAWMLKWAQPDLVIAFPGGSGTANMVGLATKASIDIWKP